jgi:hypothetical protein
VLHVEQIHGPWAVSGNWEKPEWRVLVGSMRLLGRAVGLEIRIFALCENGIYRRHVRVRNYTQIEVESWKEVALG